MTVQFIIQTQTLVKVKGEAIKSYAGKTALQEAGSKATYICKRNMYASLDQSSVISALPLIDVY